MYHVCISPYRFKTLLHHLRLPEAAKIVERDVVKSTLALSFEIDAILSLVLGRLKHVLKFCFQLFRQGFLQMAPRLENANWVVLLHVDESRKEAIELHHLG